MIDADDAVDGVLGLRLPQFVTQIVVGESLRSRVAGAAPRVVRQRADPQGRRTSTSTSSRDASADPSRGAERPRDRARLAPIAGPSRTRSRAATIGRGRRPTEPRGWRRTRARARARARAHDRRPALCRRSAASRPRSPRPPSTRRRRRGTASAGSGGLAPEDEHRALEGAWSRSMVPPPASARLSSSTFTRGSPRKPSVRLVRVLGDQRVDLLERQAAHGRDPRRLELRRRDRDVRVEPARRGGEQIDRDRRPSVTPGA